MAPPIGPGHPGGDRSDRWRAIGDAAIEAEFQTGRREPTTLAAKRSIAFRIGRIGLGTLLLLGGLAMLVLPGPGMLVTLAGLVLLSEDVPFARRFVDKVRARIPQDEQGRIPRSAVVSMVATTAVVTSGSVWFAFFRG
jgi:hypothetical protein